MMTKPVDVGPAAINRYWRHVPSVFQSGITAAVNWTDPCDLAALMRAAGVTVTEQDGGRARSSNGEHGCFTPVGIIVHHTGPPQSTAANVLAAIVLDRSPGVVEGKPVDPTFDMNELRARVASHF